MQGYYTLPETIEHDINTLQDWVNRYNLLQVTPEKFRGFRVPLGIYEQRQSETYMMRLRLPGGAILPEQMRGLARVAREKNAQIHLTTRQDIQLQNVLLDDLVPAYRALHALGLTCKGGGGNTVRNITSCPDAALCPQEAFPVFPYAVALTEYFLPKPGSYNLPRKFKIAFSGCGEDCALATINDVGFIAKIKDDVRGFSVYAGGGMGTHPRVSMKLHDFIPAEEACATAEAVRRVFDKYGDRKHRHRARLRFVVDKFGEETFRELYERELKEVRNEGEAAFSLRSEGEEILYDENDEIHSESPVDERYNEWKQFFVHPQLREGYFMAHVPVALGDASPETLEHLADVCEKVNGSLCVAQTQDFNLRRVHEDALPFVYNRLREKYLAEPRRNLGNLVCCKGASTCKLGLCLSQGACRAIAQELDDSKIYLSRLPEVRVRVSGCPNSCGQHQIGGIGLHGAARRADGRTAPFYMVLLGGAVSEAETQLAQSMGQVPAKNVPALIRDFLREYFVQKKNGGNFLEFLDAEGRGTMLRLIEKYSAMPSHAQAPEYYKDWSSGEEFSLAGRSAGECGAGVFDMIQSDLQGGRASYEIYLRTKAPEHLFQSVSALSSSLLIVKGADPKNDMEAFSEFEKYFVEEGWVSSRYRDVLNAAREYFYLKEPQKLIQHELMVPLLLSRLEELYAALDANLQFQTEKER